MYDEERPYTPVGSGIDAEGRQALWDASSGLQAVDGLEVSDRTYASAAAYVSGEISASDLREAVERDYSAAPISRQSEADIVAVRINELLDSSNGMGFRCNPSMLPAIHKMLFDGQFEDPSWVGRYRRGNFQKPEPVLGGRSVEYMPFTMIEDTLTYDFAEFSRKRIEWPIGTEGLTRFTDFISSIWQVHPFREGNTRTVATFSLLYLNSLGLSVDNTLFKEHSVHYRDALVRASYSSIADGIEEDHSFIQMFYENLVLGADHDIDAMDMNVHGIRVSSVPYREVPCVSDIDSAREAQKTCSKALKQNARQVQ